MKPITAKIGASLILAAFTNVAPVRAEQAAPHMCPTGYSLVVDVCVSDKTGDVVLPSDRK